MIVSNSLPTRVTFGRIRRFLGPKVTQYIAWGIFTGLVLFVVELAFAQLIQIFLFRLGISPRPIGGFLGFLIESRFGFALVAVVVGGCLRAACHAIRTLLQMQTTEHFSLIQRQRLVRWVFASESVNTGEVVAAFGERAHWASLGVSAFQQLALVAATLGALTISLFIIAPLVTVVSVGLLGFVGFGFRRVDRHIRSLGEGIATEWNEAHSRLVLAVRNLLLVQIHGTQEIEAHATQSNLNRYISSYVSYSRLSVFKSALPQAIGTFVICFVAYSGVKSRSLGGPSLLAYFYLFIRFVQNFSDFSLNLSNLNLSRPHLRSAWQWWERTTETLEGSNAKHAIGAPVKAKPFRTVGWQGRGIGFEYDEGKPVITGLDIDIAPGSFFVIVGPSGRGKSTLINLLIGGLRPTAGSLTINTDEGDLSVFDSRERLLASVGYVGPESFLIDGTIRENLDYGLSGNHATEAEIHEALRQAECDFVHQLPRGLEHRITEQGQGLSAGQKQRLALARALLRSPTTLILDEATANLDSATEARLVTSLAALKGRVTIVAVTHREAMLPLADRVLRL